MKVRAFVILAAAATAALAASAVAQDAPSPAGRFQLSSGDGGSFVRLDTRTGAVSHCVQEASIWRCEPILDSGLADRLAALSDRVDHMSADLDRLSLRVDRLADAAAAPAARADVPEEHESAGIARTAVHKLLRVIRTLKYGHADAT